MNGLILAPALTDPDGLFEELFKAHRGLDAGLALLLANHISDVEVLKQAIAEAVRTAPAAA